MTKTHVLNLKIINRSDFKMVHSKEWFNTGKLANSNEWPEIIEPGESKIIQCSERESSFAGCSGFVSYNLEGTELTIAFSNRPSDRNKIAAGVGGYNVWNTLGFHCNGTVIEEFIVQSKRLKAVSKFTPQEEENPENNASVEIISC